jgi:hypothetical protein
VEVLLVMSLSAKFFSDRWDFGVVMAKYFTDPNFAEASKSALVAIFTALLVFPTRLT